MSFRLIPLDYQAFVSSIEADHFSVTALKLKIFLNENFCLTICES